MNERIFSFEQTGGIDILKTITQTHRKIVPLAANRALNRTATKVRSAAVRELSKETSLQQKKIRELTEIIKSQPSTLVFSITASGRPANLIEYVPKRSRVVGAFRLRKNGKLRRGGGVKARVWGRTHEHKATFIGTGKTSGKLLVFKRDDSKRSGITGVWGPSIPKEFVQQKIKNLMDLTVDQNFEDIFARDIKSRLKGFGRKNSR